MRRTVRSLAALSPWLLLAACGDVVSLGAGPVDPPESGAGGAGGPPPLVDIVAGSGGAGPTTTGPGGGGGAGPCESGPPTQDDDGDGYTIGDGDCDDCDADVNPGAVEFPTHAGAIPVDDDCSGIADDLGQPCDSGLLLDSTDPMSAVKAVDLCKVSSGPGDWGAIDAKWILPDGAPATGLPNFDLGHGILSGFGPNLSVRRGARMLALSSGTARQPTDVEYKSPSGFGKGYQSNHPPGFPKEACPGVTPGTPHDSVALEVAVRVPTNARGFSFDFDFYTYEFSGFVCTTYNDMFVALLSPIPAGQTDGNISFDAQGYPVSVNTSFLEVCGCSAGPPCSFGGMTFPCSYGTAELHGTGFGSDSGGADHGATSWLTTTAPAAPGSTITLRWGVYDSTDSILDTTTLIDNWRWLPGPAVVLTDRSQAP